MFKKLLEKMLKPLAKSLARHVVTQEGDRLQAEAKAALLKSGPNALDGVFDKSQDRIIAGLRRAHTTKPILSAINPILARIEDMVQEHGDALQEKVKKEVSGKGPDALDVVFDRAQELLIARINAL